MQTRTCFVIRMTLLSLVFFSGGEALQGQGAPRRLTLDQANQLALETNPGIVLGQLNIREKEEGRQAAGKDYFPKLLVGAGYFRFTESLGDVLRAGPVGPVKFPIVNQNFLYTDAIVVQPITALVAVNALVEVARADVEIAAAQLDGGKRDLLHAVAGQYHQLLAAQQLQEAARLKVNVAQQKSQSTDTPDAAVALQEANAALSQATSQVSELSWQMNGLVGWDPGTQLELVEPPQPAPPASSLEEAISQALANSPEVREAQETIKKARAGHKIHKLSYWPNVDVMGGWIYQNEALEIISQKSFGFAGVTVTLFDFEWGKKRRLNEQASLQVQMAERNLTVTEGKVALEAQKAYWGFERAREALQSKRDIVRLRQQAQQGTSSSTTTAALDQAKLEEMKAKFQHALAQELLKKAISRTDEGRTRNARGNDWTPVRPLREFTPGQTPGGPTASGAFVGRNRLFPIDPLK